MAEVEQAAGLRPPSETFLPCKKASMKKSNKYPKCFFRLVCKARPFKKENHKTRKQNFEIMFHLNQTYMFDT